MDRRIVASFEKQVYATDAVNELVRRDLNPEDISLVSSAQNNERYQILDSGGQNIATGYMNAIFGTNFSPEAQLIKINDGQSILVAGPLSGVFELNPANGVSGALINYGINSEESRHFAQNVLSGNTLVVTRASEEQFMGITNTLTNHGAQEIACYGEYNDGVG